MEIFNIDVLDEGVPFASGLAVILVSFSGNSNSDSSGQVSDTLNPECLVELGVDSNIGGLHHLGDQVSDVSDSAGCFLLEGLSVGELVDVESGVDGSLSQTLSLFFLTHNHKFIKY